MNNTTKSNDYPYSHQICNAGNFLKSVERQLRVLIKTLEETKLNGDADSNRVTIEALSIQAEKLEGTAWQAKQEIESIRKAVIVKELLSRV